MTTAVSTIATYDATKHQTSASLYDAVDRVLASTDTFGEITHYGYAPDNRHTTTTTPTGAIVTDTFDAANRRTRSDETASSVTRTTKYDYDERNRQTRITDANGGTTDYVYYNDGQTLSIEDAVHNLTKYFYDIAGRLTHENSPLGDRYYQYDLVNNRTQTTDRNGRQTDYTYDNLNRLKSEQWLGDGQTFTYSYDENGNRIGASDGNINYVYSYDRTDLLERVDRTSGSNPLVSFKYTYDEIGNLTKTEELIANAPTATTLYEYDDPRYLNTKMTQTIGLVQKDVKFAYHPTTGLNTTIERYVDGLLKVKTTNAYDPHGRLTGIEHKDSSGAVIATDIYVLDDLDRVKTQTLNGAPSTIGYDNTDQVLSVTGSNTEGYTYDLNGNRTNTGYLTVSGNRLLSDGTYSYDYDAEGNRKSRTKISDSSVELYTWDYRNRLKSIVSKTSITGTVTRTVGYEYDVDDQRMSKQLTVGSGQLTVTTHEDYYLDREQIAFVTDGIGNQLLHYLYGLNVDQVLAQDSFAVNYQLSTVNYSGMVWALADRLGSVDTLTDQDGVVVNRRTFDSFGRVLSETNPNVSFRYGYTGRERDLESGLAYYRARYYDPNVGRFISVDPMGFGAGDTNLYRYVGNNSTNATDPSGEILANIGSGLLNVGIDAGIQFLTKGKIDDVNSLALSFGTGFLGYGLAAKAGMLLSKTPIIGQALGQVATKYSVATSVALNAAVDGSVGAVSQVGANIVTGKNWSENVWETGTSQAFFGGAGNAVGKGASGLWKSEGVQDLVQRGVTAAQQTRAWGIVEDASINLARKTSATIDRAWESEGFQSFLTKGLNYANRGLDAVENSLLWQNQSLQQRLRRGLGSIENALEKFENTIDNTKISDTLYESLVVNRLNYKSDIRTHLTTYEGYNKKTGFRGSHTFDSFKQGLRENPDTFIKDIRTHPSQPHLYEVTYARPMTDSKHRLIPNEDKIFQPKTLYNTHRVTDDYIIRYGQIAAAKGHNRFLTGQISRSKGNYYDILSGDTWFRNTIDDTTNQITNHFPVFHDRNILISTGLRQL